MTALQPSDKARFKDASEAEQALREAWERCLTQGLVHPAVLAMDETPHDKAPVRMHEPRGIARPSPASLPVVQGFGDSAELTAIDNKISERAQALVVESKQRRRDDDDPTTLMVRDDVAGKPKADPTRQGIGAAQKTPAPEKLKPPPDTIEDISPRIESAVETKPSVPKTPLPESGGMSKLLMVAIAVLLLAGATAVGLYVGGVLK
jgi:hypothetical protein